MLTSTVEYPEDLYSGNNAKVFDMKSLQVVTEKSI